MREITKELLEALKTIESWNSHTTAYAVDFGSNGVRDFYRAIARQSIAKAEANSEARAEAAKAAPQPAGDGWIPWAGGECPVETKGYDLFLRFRDGSERSDYVTRARGYDWKWERRGHPADIIAYRVVKP